MKYVLALLVLITLSSGCAMFKMTNGADLGNADAAAKEKRYQEAAAAYKKILAATPQSEDAPEALYQLSYLQTLYDNPQKDYARALQGFDEFIKRYPNQARLQEAKNWHALLKTLVDLKKENDRLKRNIDELKKLDIRHEQKRGRNEP